MAGDWERAGVSGMGLQVLEKIKLLLISLWRQILGMGANGSPVTTANEINTIIGDTATSIPNREHAVHIEEDESSGERAKPVARHDQEEGGGSLPEKEMKKELKTFAYWTLSISMAGNITLLTLELNPQLFWIIRLTSSSLQWLSLAMSCW